MDMRLSIGTGGRPIRLAPTAPNYRAAARALALVLGEALAAGGLGRQASWTAQEFEPDGPGGGPVLGVAAVVELGSRAAGLAFSRAVKAMYDAGTAGWEGTSADEFGEGVLGLMSQGGQVGHAGAVLFFGERDQSAAFVAMSVECPDGPGLAEAWGATLAELPAGARELLPPRPEPAGAGLSLGPMARSSGARLSQEGLPPVDAAAAAGLLAVLARGAGPGGECAVRALREPPEGGGGVTALVFYTRAWEGEAAAVAAHGRMRAASEEVIPHLGPATPDVFGPGLWGRPADHGRVWFSNAMVKTISSGRSEHATTVYFSARLAGRAEAEEFWAAFSAAMQPWMGLPGRLPPEGPPGPGAEEEGAAPPEFPTTPSEE